MMPRTLWGVTIVAACLAAVPTANAASTVENLGSPNAASTTYPTLADALGAVTHDPAVIEAAKKAEAATSLAARNSANTDLDRAIGAHQASVVTQISALSPAAAGPVIGIGYFNENYGGDTRVYTGNGSCTSGYTAATSDLGSANNEFDSYRVYAGCRVRLWPYTGFYSGGVGTITIRANTDPDSSNFPNYMHDNAESQKFNDSF